MATVIPVPTLSTFGYVYSPSEKIDFLLAHFFYSDKLQTALYGNEVSSFQWIIEEKAGSMIDTTSLVRSTATSYLQRYYETVEVNVEHEDTDPANSGSRVRLRLNVTVTENGIRYSATKLASLIDGRFKEFIDINNITG